MSKKNFGTLLIFDMGNCLGEIQDKRRLQYFIDELVESAMLMMKIGDTQFEYFDNNSYNRQHDLVGYSITQIISLSSITIHICEISRSVYLDIFTCCNVDNNIYKKIIDLIDDVFRPTTINQSRIGRSV